MRALLLILGWMILPFAGWAQQAALVADTVLIEADNRLVAEGDVQVAYEGSILTASRITYDQETDQVIIEGPLTLTDQEGTILLADTATLDQDLRNGILRSARLVLERQLQLAATEIARVGGRYTQLSNVVSSACEVCSTNATPLWEIRARKVIYDQQEELLYFDRAQFRLAGLPVAFIPRLRLPSPDNARQSGVLTPRLVSSSALGFGVKVPYFQTLGPSADLTLTPYIADKTTTVEGRYRQNFTTGGVEVSGAVSDDDLLPDDTRYYLFADGAFFLPRDFLLEFDLRRTSDRTYLAQYGYAYLSRLEDEVRVLRYDRNQAFRTTITGYEPLTGIEAEIKDELPAMATDLAFERRSTIRNGELRFGIDASTVRRDSGASALGRDVAEFGASLGYFTREVLPQGLVWSNRTFVSGGTYAVSDDPTFDDVFRVAGGIQTELRLPLQRTSAGGTHHLIEPVVQLAWSGASDDVPNEDSVLVDFDEGNLFALNRFPGDDRIEEGARANLGLSYTARLPSSARINTTLGRVIRNEADLDFNEGSGLSGTTSDWLAATDLEFSTFRIGVRALVDDSFDATRTEAIASYSGEKASVSGSYLFLDAEPLENRPDDTHEFDLNSSVRISRHWKARGSGRYDLNTDGLDGAELGIIYQTECVRIELNASKSFYRRLEIDPVTRFGFEVELLGFGAGSTDESYRSTCQG